MTIEHLHEYEVKGTKNNYIQVYHFLPIEVITLSYTLKPKVQENVKHRYVGKWNIKYKN